MADFNDDPVEFRKEVWRGVRNFGKVLTLAPVNQEKLAGLPPGLAVFADQREKYCDGRTPPQKIDRIDGKDVLYIKLVEPDEPTLEKE